MTHHCHPFSDEIMAYPVLYSSLMRPTEVEPYVGDSNPHDHIDEKRISKFYKDGLLDSFDFESFEVCESCLLGKITKISFIGQGERVSDLLDLINSDVCRPLSKNARGGCP